MTPEKQVIPAEDLTRNSGTPISCVLFGPSGREGHQNLAGQMKPGITQITSLKIAEGDMGDVYVGKDGRRTPASLVWAEIAKGDRRGGARIPSAVSEMSPLKARSQCKP